MENKDLLQHAIKIQDELNAKIDSNWKKHRNILDFKIAIVQEVSELIDSYAWKWWKKMEENSFNKKIEIVDIFHFMLSELILLKYIDRISYNEVDFILEKYKKSIDNIGTSNNLDELSDLELIMHFLSKEINNSCQPAFVEFFYIVDRNFDSLEEFLNLYFIKNILNEIRQMKGYKSGNYCKVINGKEDNEIIFDLVRHLKFDTYDELRDHILEKYLTLYDVENDNSSK